MLPEDFAPLANASRSNRGALHCWEIACTADAGITPACDSAVARAASKLSIAWRQVRSESHRSTSSLRNNPSRSFTQALSFRLFPSDFFDDQCDALADADAHRAELILSFGAPQVIRGGCDGEADTPAQRLTDRDCPACWIDIRGVDFHSKL